MVSEQRYWIVAFVTQNVEFIFDECCQTSVDTVHSNGLQQSAVSAYSKLEADSAVAVVQDLSHTVSSSCDVTQAAAAAAARTGPTVDGGRELSLSDGFTRREDRHRSGNLSIVSEESSPKSSFQGSLLLWNLHFDPFPFLGGWWIKRRPGLRLIYRGLSCTG